MIGPNTTSTRVTVHANHGDVPRDVHAHLAEGGDHVRSDLVGGADDSLRQFLAGQQHLGGGAARLAAEGGAHKARRQARSLHRLFVTQAAPMGSHTVGALVVKAAHVGDRGQADVAQVVGGHVPDGDVVYAHARHPVHHRAGDHHGNRQGVQSLGGEVSRGGHQDHQVGLVGQIRPGQEARPGGGGQALLHAQRGVQRAKHVVDPGQDRTEHPAVRLRDHRRDPGGWCSGRCGGGSGGPGAAGSDGGRPTGGARDRGRRASGAWGRGRRAEVAEPAGDRQDFPALLGGDAGGAAQRPRDRGDGNVGGGCDVSHCNVAVRGRHGATFSRGLWAGKQKRPGGG